MSTDDMAHVDVTGLLTESVAPAFADIDRLGVADLARLINEQDAGVPAAVAAAMDQIVAAIDAVAARLAAGGRLLYVGAGTAGRLGVLDAAECPPTFGTAPDLVQGVIAGGEAAMFAAVEGAEDDGPAGARMIADRRIGPADAVVGIAASGRTPYVLGALRAARAEGALTVALSCTSPAETSAAVDHSIEILVGPEVVAGSTRLKAGTAQKLVLNMISTVTMVRAGKTYGNLMVDVKITNGKLAERAVGIVQQITGVGRDAARTALSAANQEVKVATVMLRDGLSADAARGRLAEAGGHLRLALGEAQA